MAFTFKKKRLSEEEYVQGILNQDRIILSKAITLVESKLQEDSELAELLLQRILPHTGNSLRIGITGVPGAGKSTFIEAFGKILTARGKKIAVLTVDPSSRRTQGSILGDKTRMEKLANDSNVFVRPSASGKFPGGVHAKTRESILFCEAAGFDVIIVETVGVGQSETAVKGITDFFLLLMLAGAGDELQGIKRGIMEAADAIAINKVDGDNVKQGRLAQRQYQHALHAFSPNASGWRPKVMTCSAINDEGIDDIWSLICNYEKMMKANGVFKINRQQQNLQWMRDMIFHHLQNDFFAHERVKSNIDELSIQVETGQMPATTAAKKLLDLFSGKS